MIAITRVKPDAHFLHRSRRGVSLIELLIVICIGSVIIGLCVTTMHVLLRVERDQARSVRLTTVLSRVRQVFSDDAHGSIQAEIGSGDGDRRRLQLAKDGADRVVYSADEHILMREEFEGDQLKHRDDFHFPPGTEFRFEQEPAPRFVRIDIAIAAVIPDDIPDRSPGKTGANTQPPPRTLSIEARLDRDRRFSGGGK